MSENFLDNYPLDYLITNKDKTSDFYILLHNVCDDLLDGHKPDEAELGLAWNTFRILLFLATDMGRINWGKVYGAFSDTFNRTNESPDEFMKWILSDMINEFLLTPFDWESIRKSPINFLSVEDKKRTVKPRKPDKGLELFFQDYVNQGGGHAQRPNEEDLRSFAKEILQFIEEPKIRAVLRKLSFGHFKDWLPEEIQKALDNIGRLTLRDGKMLFAAKPLLENLKNDLVTQSVAQVKSEQLEKHNQKGRYRLTEYEIKRRKKIVKDAIRIFKKSNPKKTWKQIAYELDIPERTLRDWRHNPQY
jgi:hypothetical protein